MASLRVTIGAAAMLFVPGCRRETTKEAQGPNGQQMGEYKRSRNCRQNSRFGFERLQGPGWDDNDWRAEGLDENYRTLTGWQVKGLRPSSIVYLESRIQFATVTGPGPVKCAVIVGNRFYVLQKDYLTNKVTRPNAVKQLCTVTATRTTQHGCVYNGAWSSEHPRSGELSGGLPLLKQIQWGVITNATHNPPEVQLLPT
ncbi:hypothetical protein CSOJ01_00161 [Colletotrichum sojae]|uniref:Uncharacterized protein n=1 Tax=Colletotrichum sojae TaxID=2175907 RepID=A0A8H6N6Q2_9PEZI|nr:hypothetical protein CSOJ01_00161 [Colletotrichum sojae]